jgi:CRP-like cAMP-binding protein
MTDTVDYTKLSQIPLLKNVSNETLSQLAGSSRRVIVEPGELLFRQGGTPRDLYLIEEGKLEVVREYDDESIVVAVLGPGEVTGELSTIIGSPHTATVQAVERTSLIAISRDAFFDCLGRDPGMSSQVLLQMAQRLQNTNTRVMELAMDNAEARLASMVLFMSEDKGEFRTGLITDRLRRNRLARAASVDLNWLNETLKEWSYEGFIGLDGRRLLVHDIKALQEIAGWE